MQINTQEIQDGLRDGETVWICHYNKPSVNKKPLRNISTTKVLVCSNDELPDNKRVYYSRSHFRPLGSKGQPLSRVISPVDNTGYRSRAGNPLFVFDNADECIDTYDKQFEEASTRALQNLKEQIEIAGLNLLESQPTKVAYDA